MQREQAPSRHHREALLWLNPKKIWRARFRLWAATAAGSVVEHCPEAAVPRIATCDRRCVFRVRALYLMVFELGVCTLGVTCVLHVFFASGELLSVVDPIRYYLMRFYFSIS